MIALAVAEYADCGIALDPDAVREALYDASGEPLGDEAAAERISALAEALND